MVNKNGEGVPVLNSGGEGGRVHSPRIKEIFQETSYFYTTNNFLIEKISVLMTSSCKGDQIAPLIKELEELEMKLTLFRSWFLDIYLMSYILTEDEEKVMAALTTFFDRATCLIYFSFIRNLNEDMLVTLRKHFSLLIEESEIKEMSLVLGIIFNDELESDIDISLSLLKRQEEYQIGSPNGEMLEDHILSLKHGIELLEWVTRIFIDSDLNQSDILLARNVKQKLERLTYMQEDESLKMDVDGAYAGLREDMKNLIINPSTNKYDILFPHFDSGIFYLRENNDFLLEKITTLVTSDCKADQIAPLKEELEDLRKMVAFLKPLLRYEVTDFSAFFTIHNKATILIYLSFVGKMDTEMTLLVKSNIAEAIKQIDILEIYTVILNEKLDVGTDYLEEDLYLIENLILLLENNFESLSDANSKLYNLLIDIHIFLLGLPPNVFLRKLHLLEVLSQDILSHSIPIVCSCYLKHAELYISTELNWVMDLINRFKFESGEIKLYYFPRVDDLGFLEFFSGYMEDLLKNQEISMKEEIHALHIELQPLFSLAKLRNQELNEKPWTNIIHLVYQAEYIIDLYLIKKSRDLGLISYLSKIVEQLKNVRADMNDAVNWNLSDICKTLPAEDVAMTSKPEVLGTTTQVANYDGIVGMHEEIRNIMEHLLNGENQLDVVSIVGMAGVGKTTLAVTLYNNPIMADRFDILAWCTVSQSYQNRELLLAILNQVNASDKNPKSTLDEQGLADHLCRSLRKRRYLIVFDDIWDSTLWNDLKRYLPDDRNGSRILITTRNKDVADHIMSKVRELHGLSAKNSLELFLKRIPDKESLSKDLLKCSKIIVEHCKGLPISIVIIAGILSGLERTKNKWNEIAESVSSRVLSDSQGKCKAILELSYNHLPNHLRSCFLYLASYPEDQEISVNDLLMRWIGEGLILGTKSDSSEEVARKYMEELIVKNLVITAKERSRGGVRTFRLHDLLRDFCLNKAREKHFFTVLDSRNLSQALQDPRRIIINKIDVDRRVQRFSCHSIRSLICSVDLVGCSIEKTIGCHDMVLLKVLEGYGFEDLFPNLSSLVHLRYLALGLWGQISVLPDLISKLHNLQVLILYLRYVIKVPDFIWDMVKLRHVHITTGASFKVDSNRLGNSSFFLENLRSLSTACISRGDLDWLSKLSGLQRLCCHLVDHEVQEETYISVDDLGEDEDLKEYTKDDDKKDDDDLEDNQFQMLRFNSQLISLKMENFFRKNRQKFRFISTCQLPSSLRKLTLSRFYLKSSDISKIGSALPHLEVFKIHSCYVPSQYKWYVVDDDFPKLKVLKLTRLHFCKWIVSENAFPNLEQLWVDNCKYLEEIPLDFGYLLKLRYISVRDCQIPVIDSAREIEKIQHEEEQNTEMRVHILPTRW